MTNISIEQNLERRLRTGEFYTPHQYARLALEYLQRTVGNWYHSEHFRLWDMAAGTGNLELPLPPNTQKYCYLSTLRDDDVEYCRQSFPDATVFRYDYLNDEPQSLPQQLRAELDDPTLEWIILINPPYAMANNFERRHDRVDKSAVSMTNVRRQMTTDGLGVVSRELYAQFLYRINKEFRNRRATLAMFSKLNYINATNDERLRDRFFDYKFLGGFVFPSTAFANIKGKFPIIFAMWRLDQHVPLQNQKLKFDVIDENLNVVAVKQFTSAPRSELLNAWIERPKCTVKFPPLSSALKLATNHKDRRDRVAEGFLASLMCNGNDFTHQIKTALLSAPYVSAGALSVTAANFEQSMIVHAVRHIERATWLNDKDQFFRPSKPLPTAFVNDCVIWSLFAPSNNTAALSNVEYEGKIYQIRNELFPFPISELIAWGVTGFSFDGERFAAIWLSSKILSTESTAILSAAKSIYKTFYKRLNELDRARFKITTWDAGWHQVRFALKAARLLDEKIFRAAHENLRRKLLPATYELGFLR